MMTKGIAHAAFNVKDMDKTIEFYEKTLGFRKAFEIARPGTGEPWIVYIYGGGGQFIELFCYFGEGKAYCSGRSSAEKMRRPGRRITGCGQLWTGSKTTPFCEMP